MKLFRLSYHDMDYNHDIKARYYSSMRLALLAMDNLIKSDINLALDENYDPRAYITEVEIDNVLF